MTQPTAGEIVRASLAASVGRLSRADPVIRAGSDPEGVHQARVATRRMRSDLRVFGAMIERDWAAALRAELSWLAEVLGRARDADVLLDRIREDSGGWSEREQEEVLPIIAKLQGQDDEANREVLSALDSGRYVALRARLDRVATEVPLRPAAARPASEVLPGLLRGPWEGLEEAAARADRDPTDRALHQVRIAAKRLRYAAEAVAPAIPPAAELALAASSVQTVLGEHQDAVVAEAWMREAGASDLAERERRAALKARSKWRASVDHVLEPGLDVWL